MKRVLEVCLVLGLLFGSGKARAQFAVIVAADPERDIEWGIDLGYWDAQIANLEETNSQLAEANATLTDSLIVLRDIDRRIGEPSAGSVAAYASSTTPRTSSNGYVRTALNLTTVMSQDDGSATLTRTNQSTQAAIGTSYTLDGISYTRDTSRYRIIEQEEKLRDAYKAAVTDFHAVQQKELDFQEGQSAALTSGVPTASEIQARTAAIEASRGRVELSKNRMELARAELDQFVGQIEFEERKIEAARWEEKDMAKANENSSNDAVKTLVSGQAVDDQYDF